jgi:hypothetical protein
MLFVFSFPFPAPSPYHRIRTVKMCQRTPSGIGDIGI